MRITDLITHDEFAWYFISVGNEKEQQMPIEIFLLGF